MLSHAGIPRLNGAIRALEQGKPAFVAFTPADVGSAQALADSGYDAVVYEMEHAPFDARTLKDCLQYMLSRRQIVESGSLAPAVTPMVRIPPNGGEMNQWVAKQVLDQGVYGVVWPHVSTVLDAQNAVAACRYPPAGQRGDAPAAAARYWGLGQQEYYKRADVWPLAPDGEILVVVMCEEARAIDTLPDILRSVPGIGVVLIGEGDLSQDLGYPRQYDHPIVARAISRVLAICKEFGVPCGHPHVDEKNVERLLDEGFRWLMPGMVRTSPGLELGRKLAAR
jgi:4-hydroxy-2-oxoheptanedioate aldolase